jgi:hypothetical protein
VKAFYLNGEKQENGTYNATTNPDVFEGDGMLVVDSDLVLPAGPTDLTATSILYNQASIQWTINADNADGYVIRRDYWLVDSVGADVDTITVTGLYAEHTFTIAVYAYNLLGNSDTAYLEVTTPQEPVGIDLPEDEVIRVFPNPVKEVLHVSGTAEAPWELYDLQGHLLKTGRTADIGTAGLLPGSYVLKVYRVAGDPVRLRFLKE